MKFVMINIILSFLLYCLVLVGCSKDKGSGISIIANILKINNPGRSRLFNSDNTPGLINYPPTFSSTLPPLEIAMSGANLSTLKALATISNENYQYLIYNEYNPNVDFFYTSVIQNNPALFYFASVIETNCISEQEDVCFVKALLHFKKKSEKCIRPQHDNTKRNSCPTCKRRFTLRDGFEWIYKKYMQDIEYEFGIRGSASSNDKIQCDNCFIASCVKSKAHSNNCTSLLKDIYTLYNSLNQNITDSKYGEYSIASSRALQLRKAFITLSCVECDAKIIDLHLDKIDDFMNSNTQGSLFQCSNVEGRGLKIFAPNSKKEVIIYINYSICPRCWLTKKLRNNYFFSSRVNTGLKQVPPHGQIMFYI